MMRIEAPIYEAEDATVWGFTGALLGSKHYLILEHRNNVTFVVDSGFGDSEVVSTARRIGRETVALFLTHGHFDHAGAASHISRELHCPVRLHSADLKTIKASNFLLKVLGHSVRMEMPELTLVNESYSDDVVSFLGCPGHTPGSVLIRCGALLFTGDSVYADQVDAIILPQQNNDLLRKSLLMSIDAIVSADQIFPGHGPRVAGSDLLARNRQLTIFLGLDNAR